MSDIVISNLTFSYAKGNVLENINFAYDISDFLAIIGPNGGGKSTLLKLIVGLLSPSIGDIKVFGKKPIEMAKKIAYVGQNTNLNPNFPMTALDVVLMGRIDEKRFGFYSKKDKSIALESMERVGVEKFAVSRLDELSGGQRQRVFIARALSANAKALMMDEPTSSIDTKGQAQIYEILSSLNKEGIGITVISHDTNVILAYASKMAYVSKTLHLHNTGSSRAKANMLKTLETSGHLCPIELITGAENA